jgi:very-short-patch-repair endonuclease
MTKTEMNAIIKKRPDLYGKGSIGELTLETQLIQSGIKGYEREHRFAPPRRFRFDFAFPEKMIAVEIDGGLWGYGRHNRPQGMMKDNEKFNLAASLGWRILKFDTSKVRSGEAIKTIEEVLKA